jgi:Spy/CpxP family protein refolding chaperone
MNQTTTEQHLVKAEEHVRAGEDRVRRQRALLEQLARDGHDTREARSLLKQFEEIQATFIAERDRLRNELGLRPV